MQSQQINLFYSEGSSDKEYHAELLSCNDGFMVKFAYGRRGSTLTIGNKTTSPVAYDKARKIYDRLIAEKKGKGYTESESGAAYQDAPADKTFTGVKPMLLNPIDKAQVDVLLNDSHWGMQIKYDGERRLICQNTVDIIGINRKGLVVSLPRTVEETVAVMPFDQLLIDGESIGNVYVAFDLLEKDGQDLRGLSYLERYNQLLGVIAYSSESVIFAPLHTDREAKRQVFADARLNKEEGVVFKRLDAPYSPGCPNSGGNAVKFKFVESATVMVAAINDKRSVAIVVYDAAGITVPVGNVTIPPSHALPPVGAVSEVEYLYAFPTLYQPVYKGVRSDQDACDCTLAKLKLKKGITLPLAAYVLMS